MLRDLLRPPAGMRVEQAVGTTFTVDLSTALLAPLSLAASELGAAADPIGVLQTVRSVADRIDVFYQAGQARVPAASSDVFAVLEPVLHAVRAPRPGHLFHPKVWLLHYVDAEGRAGADEADVPRAWQSFRLVVATRNLTDDHSWDAVVSLDGSLGLHEQPRNAPLQALIASLPGMCTTPLPSARASRVRRLARAAGRVTWDLAPSAIELDFHAWGLPKAASRGGPTASADFTGWNRLVVSPFLDFEGLATVAPAVKGKPTRTVLVSRQETLDRLTAEADLPAHVTPMVMSVVAELEDERAAGELAGLHAKITVVQRDRRSHLVVGSPNATRAGYGGNVEFAVEMVFGMTHGVDLHLSADRGMGALLEDYTQQPPVEDPESDLRRTLRGRLRELAAQPWTVTVTPGDVGHRVTVTSGTSLPEAGEGLTVEMLTRRGCVLHGAAGTVLTGVIDDVPLADVTAFIALGLAVADVREQTVVPAVLVGEPDGRLDAVLARQVDSPEKFLDLVTMMLRLDAGWSSAARAADEGGSGTWSGGSGAGLFEAVVRALADAPGSLDDLGRVLGHLDRGAGRRGSSVIPPGFRELWESVVAARARLEALT